MNNTFNNAFLGFSRQEEAGEGGFIDPTPVYPWAVTDPQLIGSKSLTEAGTSLQGIYFKQDGTSFYVLSSLVVSQYDMSTSWDVTTATFQTGKQKDVSAEDTNAADLFFKSDGTKLFINGVAGRDTTEYNLSTAWDVSSATASTQTSHNSDRNVGLFFDSTGTRMYISGVDGDKAYQYTLGTAWSISTLSYVKPSVTVDLSPHAIYFKPDGSRMFISGNNSQTIREYELSTPWDIGNITLNQTFSMSQNGNNANGMSFRDSDGAMMFLASGVDNAVYAFTL